MNKDNFNNFLSQSLEKVQTFGNKIGNQKHLAAIRDAFAIYIPFIIVGSFALLINSVFIEPTSLLATLCGAEPDTILYENWEHVSIYVSPLFSGIVGATMDFFALYIAILLGYFLAESYGDSKIFGGMIGLACFLALQPTNALSDNPIGYFDSTGVLFAMIAGLIGPTIFHHVSTSEKLKIKMPEGVPPSINDTFNSLFAVMITIIIFGSFQPVWGAFAYGVGFGATSTTHEFYTLTGTITYQLSEKGDDFTKTGTINIEQGTGLYTILNIYYSLNIVNEPTIKEIIEVGSNINIINTVPNDFFGNWFMNQIITIIDKESWINIELQKDGLGDATLRSISTSESEQIKGINQDWYYLINGVNSLIVLPLQDAADSAWFVFLLYGLSTFLFFFGIHGPNTLVPIIYPLFFVALFHNVDVLSAYDSIPLALESGELRTFTDQTATSFLLLGGTGATTGLMMALWMFSKSPSSIEVNKVSTPPSIFNINEPYIFGIPIMLNPIYALPFILLNPFMGVFVYWITAIGWMNPTMFYVPWTTPIILSGFIATADWRSIIVSIGLIAVSFAAYTPFVFLDAKSQVKKQLAQEENEEYIKLKESLEKVNKNLLINVGDEKLKNKKRELKLKLEIVENKFSEIFLFNVNAHIDGNYFKQGEDLIEKKYALIIEDTFNEKPVDNKKQLNYFNTELKFLSKEAKYDSKIIEKNDILLNKLINLEDQRDQSVAKYTEKIELIKEKSLRIANKIVAKENIHVKKIKNELILIDQKDLSENLKLQETNLLKEKIAELKAKLKVNKEQNETKKIEKINLEKEKILIVKRETKEKIDELKETQKNYEEQLRKKIIEIQNKKADQLLKYK